MKIFFFFTARSSSFSNWVTREIFSSSKSFTSNNAKTQDKRRNERVDNNYRAEVQAIPSITHMDATATKEIKTIRKSAKITPLTLLRGNDLYFDSSITLHKFILSD